MLCIEYRQKEYPTYSYLVKIIPPNNKKRATAHKMYDVERRFESPDALTAQIRNSFGDEVVQPMKSFQIEYFESWGSAKRWISRIETWIRCIPYMNPVHTSLSGVMKVMKNKNPSTL